MTGGAGYTQRHLEHSDYYDEGRRVQGEWHGQGAELLGLRREVTREQFEAVREGLHPETGEFLRPRYSADRIDVNGSEQSKGRSLYDLTFSAPKSISILALVGGDERLIAAHDIAVREALAEAENYAAARVLTEIYRNALAREVNDLRYKIEPRRDSKGRDHGFEIRGVSDQLLEKYRVRSAQRDAAIERFTLEHGRKPTNNEIAVLVRESRADKLAEISTEKLRKQQQARLLPEESHALKHLHEESVDRAGEIPNEPTQAAESLQHAKEHLFERSSVVCEHELMTEALRHGRGKIDRHQLRGALELEQSQGFLIRAGNNLATRESLEREQRMIAAVDGGIGRYERLGGKRGFIPSERLRDEQHRYVLQILDSQNLVNYKSGQILLFHRSSHGIEKHEALTVELTDKLGIVAKDQHGVERTVSPSQARSFSVHECQQIEVAPGDKLLLTGNRGAADFRATNGELVKVRDVDGGRIHLEDGRTLSTNCHEFDHGYAVTAHRSQGKTVGAVILSADAMKQELFYVGASRGRQGIIVVTSDREQLRNMLGISTARPSATEPA
jgi:hypothetical protein